MGFDWAVVPTWIAAGAGMIGALAAWRAASASASTSRDAAEALGITIKPSLEVIAAVTGAPTKPILMITNTSAFPAKDVRVTVTMQKGGEVQAQVERLAGAVHLANQPVEPPLVVDLPADPDAHDIVGSIRLLHIGYSDDRRLCRYDYSWRIDVTRYDDGRVGGYGWTRTEADDRIDGPGNRRLKKPDWLWPSPP